MKPRPEFVPRTGEIELAPDGQLPAAWRGKPVVVTEKVDGFSISFGAHRGRFFCSTRDREVNLNENTPYGRACRELDLPGRVRGLEDVVIQAELCGPGVRGNPLRLRALEVYVFDVLRGGVFLPHTDAARVARDVGLETVPLLARLESVPAFDALVTFAAGAATLNPDVAREGAVFRAADASCTSEGRRLSFKLFNAAVARPR